LLGNLGDASVKKLHEAATNIFRITSADRANGTCEGRRRLPRLVPFRTVRNAAHPYNDCLAPLDLSPVETWIDKFSRALSQDDVESDSKC
jgi:hypothetical protein